MDTKFLLHTDHGSVRKSVLEMLEKSEQHIQNDVKGLKNWINENGKVPEYPGDNFVELFLIINKFNLEKCKKKLETYYSIRTKIPDLYVDKNPKLDHMQAIANVVYCIPLPVLTPSLSRVIVIKIHESNLEKFHAYNFFAHTFNVIEIRLREDVVLSDTILYDWQGVKWGHCLKMTPVHLKKSSTVLEVHVHKNLESLYKHIPKDVLPKDYGGLCQPLSVFHELWKQKFKESQHIFDNLERIQAQLSTKTSSNIFFETELPTNFKSLELD